MKNKDTFRFKIVEETSAELCDDLKTIRKSSVYFLYRKVSWFLGGWQAVLSKSYFPEFGSAEDARQRAYEYVNRALKNRKIDAAKKKLKDELKTKVKIISDFEINADS
jgi:hypothetical protein